MARLELLAGLVATWCAFRLLAGRATLATRDFARLFVVGLAGSTAAAFLIERLALSVTTHQHVTGIYAGPIEEVAKALPLLAVLAFFGGWRRLTIADWALTGLAGAAGFTFGQWWLELLTPGEPLVWHWYLLGSTLADVPGQVGGFGRGTLHFSGAATTAFVGLLIGLGVRLGRRRRVGLVLGLVGLALTATESGVYRYEIGPLEAGAPIFLGPMPGWAAFGEHVLRQGQFDLWFVIVGLVLAGWTEGRWALASAPDSRRVLLPDEATVPLVLAEWIVAARRVSGGWAAFERVNRYFRRRRQYMLALAGLAREPASEPLVAEALEVRDRLVLDRRELELPPADGALPPRALRQPLLARWLRDHALQGTGFIIAAAVLAVSPPDLPGGLRDAIGSSFVGPALALAALVLALPQLRRARVSVHSLEGRDARDLQRLTLGTALALGILALIASFASTLTLVPELGQRTMMLEPIERWASGDGYPLYGGNPHTLLAVLAFLAVCAEAVSRMPPGTARGGA